MMGVYTGCATSLFDARTDDRTLIRTRVLARAHTRTQTKPSHADAFTHAVSASGQVSAFCDKPAEVMQTWCPHVCVLLSTTAVGVNTRVGCVRTLHVRFPCSFSRGGGKGVPPSCLHRARKPSLTVPPPPSRCRFPPGPRHLQRILGVLWLPTSSRPPIASNHDALHRAQARVHGGFYRCSSSVSARLRTSFDARVRLRFSLCPGPLPPFLIKLFPPAVELQR